MILILCYKVLQNLNKRGVHLAKCQTFEMHNLCSTVPLDFRDAQPLLYCSNWLELFEMHNLCSTVPLDFRDAQPLLYCSTWLELFEMHNLCSTVPLDFRDAQPLLYCSTWLELFEMHNLCSTVPLDLNFWRYTTFALLFHLTWPFHQTWVVTRSFGWARL